MQALPPTSCLLGVGAWGRLSNLAELYFAEFLVRDNIIIHITLSWRLEDIMKTSGPCQKLNIVTHSHQHSGYPHHSKRRVANVCQKAGECLHQKMVFLSP